MSRLPRFEQEGAPGFQPVTIPTQGAASLTALGQQLQQVSTQQILKQQVQRATALGAQAGEQPGQLTLPTGTGIAQQAFNQAALQANKTMLGTDIILKTAQLRQNAVEQNPDAAQALAQFNADSQQYINNLLPNVPEQNRAFATNFMAAHIGQAQIALQQNLIKQQRIKGNAQFMVSDAAFQNDINNSINNINWNTTPEQVQQQIDAVGSKNAQRENTIQLAEEAQLITPKEATRLLLQNRQSFVNNLTISQFQSALRDNRGDEFLKQVENNQLTRLDSISPIQRSQLVSQLLTVQKQFENTQGVNRTVLNQQMNQEIKTIQSTGKPLNTNLITTVGHVFGESRAQQFVQDASDASFQHDRSLPIILSPINQQQALLNQLKPQDTDAPDFDRAMKNFNSINSLVSSANHQIDQDKVKYFQNSPAVVSAANTLASQLNSGVDFNQLQSIGYKPNTPNPLQQLVAAQIIHGIPLDNTSILSVPEAQGLVGQIKSMPIPQQVQFLQQLGNLWGPNLSSIGYRDLVKLGKLPSQSQFLIGMNPNDPRIIEVSAGLNLPDSENKFKKVDLTNDSQVGSDMTNYIQSLQGFKSPKTASYINNIKQYVGKVASAFSAEGEDDNTATTHAAETIADRFNYTSIGGQTIAVPKAISLDAVTRYAKDQESILPALKYKIPVSLQGTRNAATLYFKTVIQPGHWATNASNTGLVWIDKNGIPALDSDGHMVGFTFGEALHWTPPKDQLANLRAPILGR